MKNTSIHQNWMPKRVPPLLLITLEGFCLLERACYNAFLELRWINRNTWIIPKLLDAFGYGHQLYFSPIIDVSNQFKRGWSIQIILCPGNNLCFSCRVGLNFGCFTSWQCCHFGLEFTMSLAFRRVWLWCAFWSND